MSIISLLFLLCTCMRFFFLHLEDNQYLLISTFFMFGTSSDLCWSYFSSPRSLQCCIPELFSLINSFFCNLTFCSLLSLMYWSIWIPVTFSPSAACLPQDLSLPDWSLTQPSAPHIWTGKIHWKLDKTVQIMFWEAFLGLWIYFTAFSSMRRTLLARSPSWNGLQLDLYSTFWCRGDQNSCMR